MVNFRFSVFTFRRTHARTTYPQMPHDMLITMVCFPTHLSCRHQARDVQAKNVHHDTVDLGSDLSRRRIRGPWRRAGVDHARARQRSARAPAGHTASHRLLASAGSTWMAAAPATSPLPPPRILGLGRHPTPTQHRTGPRTAARIGRLRASLHGRHADDACTARGCTQADSTDPAAAVWSTARWGSPPTPLGRSRGR